LVLSLLCDERLLAHAELRPVREYLGAAGDGPDGPDSPDSPDSIDLRRCQLSSQIAHLFEEYSYSRQELLDGWRTGCSLPAAFAETERWQRRLWLALWRPGGLIAERAAAAGEEWFTAARLFHELRGGELAVRGELHLFGISYVARAYQSI